MGREVALLIRQINRVQPQWNLVGFFDDKATGSMDTLPILGGITELNKWQEKVAIAVAVADPHAKAQLVDRVDNPHIYYPILVHPLADAGDTQNVLGRGCILARGCALTVNVKLGDFVFINMMTAVGHDSQIGSFSSVMPHCCVAGNSTIGEKCLLGTGAAVLQHVTIHNGATVGAGAVVVKDVPAGAVVTGVPARIH